MPLLLKKRNIRHAPWRIIYQYPPGQAHATSGRTEAELPECGFRTKREAQPFYDRLLAIGDWDQHPTWDAALRQQAGDILEETPMRQQVQTLQKRDPWRK